MKHYHVRAFARGLHILENLNLHNGLTLAETANLTQLTKPTALRLLRSLEHDGYVSRNPFSKTYHVTSRTRLLSHGHTQDAWISDVASPIMEDLSADIVWPVYLARLEGTKTVVIWSTSYQSRIAVNRFRSGLALPALATASGMTYIANLGHDAAEEILALCLKDDPESLGQAGVKRSALTGHLKKIRQDGFFYFKPNWIGREWLTVPTYFKDRIFAALSIEFHDVDYSADHLKSVYVPKLQKAAQLIAKGVSQLDQEMAFGA